MSRRADATASLDGIPHPVFTSHQTKSIELHKHLRALILDSTLPPGTSLRQTELARVFGISRATVGRRVSHASGERAHRRRTQPGGSVRAFDSEELDQLYGTRIALESLGVRVTTGRLTPAESAEAHRLVEEMERLKAANDMTGWGETHRRFHAICMSRIADPLARTVNSFSERSERYLRLYQIWHPQPFDTAHQEHEAILAAVAGNYPAEAATLMARHLAHTALTVLRDLSPNSTHHAVLEAVAMVSGDHLSTSSSRSRANLTGVNP
ncbi:GntR family transcriptional regulator [Rhodococcus opacus]|uniref:GntR family transcriptional regulator n=1 Tax=Rhodococcus opacus TaxID=37919 RepID=UPI000FFB569A|nr:GntR family transcriptional regulator [Rhodococcus opacus]